MVSHGHIIHNGKRTTVPSERVFVNDTVSIREGSKKSVLFSNVAEKTKDYKLPNWLTFDVEKLIGKIVGKPKNSEGYIDLNTVLEFYSR